MIYDYIVIGAGMGGISAGLNLAYNKEKVLILEKNSLPGGLVTTFKRGRFEFDTALYDLYDYGDNQNRGSIQNLLQKYEIDVDAVVVPFNTRIKTMDSKEDLIIKGDFDNFILELEKLTINSIEPLKEFIKITKEIHIALKHLLKGEKQILEKDYPNFYKYLNMTALDALVELKIPEETIHRLGYLWFEIGSPLNKLSFIDFADFMNKIIFKKTCILKNKSLDLVLKLVKKYQSLGGKIHYNSYVIDIKRENSISVITTKDGVVYKAKHVICDLAKRYVFKDLIKDASKEIKQLENARTMSANGVIVYLGLNKNCRELGLKNYKYYHFNNINSQHNFKKMNKLKHNSWVGIVPNVVNEFASPRNTTILVLKTMYYGNVFDKVSMSNYQALKEDIALDLIKQFEEAFKIDIKEYIEEIEIATPFTIERYTNNLNGSMLGYMRYGYDNCIHRIISRNDEEVPDLTFVGGSSIFGAGVDNAFYSGNYLTNKLLKNKSGNKEE